MEVIEDGLDRIYELNRIDLLRCCAAAQAAGLRQEAIARTEASR